MTCTDKRFRLHDLVERINERAEQRDQKSEFVPYKHRKWIVYKAESKETRQLYIGITRQELEKRIANHMHLSKTGLGGPFHRALEFDNFKWSIIAYGLNEDEARTAERNLINEAALSGNAFLLNDKMNSLKTIPRL